MSKLKVSIRSIVMFLFALMFVVAGLSLLSRYTSEQFIYRSKKPLKIDVYKRQLKMLYDVGTVRKRKRRNRL